MGGGGGFCLMGVGKGPAVDPVGIAGGDNRAMAGGSGAMAGGRGGWSA
ncbi:hypothetical protein JDS67_28450, partial [Bacillus cereus]|nr:hypothetical protein [Bacillus cereus]